LSSTSLVRTERHVIVHDSGGYLQSWHGGSPGVDQPRRVAESLVRDLMRHTLTSPDRFGVVGIDLRCEAFRAVAAGLSTNISRGVLTRVTQRLCDPKAALELVSNLVPGGDGTRITVEIDLAGSTVMIEGLSLGFTMGPWHIRRRGREVLSFDQGLTRALGELLSLPGGGPLKIAMSQGFATKDLFMVALRAWGQP